MFSKLLENDDYDGQNRENIAKVFAFTLMVSIEFADVLSRYTTGHIENYRDILKRRIGAYDEKMPLEADVKWESTEKAPDGSYFFMMELDCREGMRKIFRVSVYPRGIEVPENLRGKAIDMALPGGAGLYVEDDYDREITVEEIQAGIKKLKGSLAEVYDKNRDEITQMGRDFISQNGERRRSSSEKYDALHDTLGEYHQVINSFLRVAAISGYIPEADELVSFCLEFTSRPGLEEYYSYINAESLAGGSALLANRLDLIEQIGSLEEVRSFVEKKIEPLFNVLFAQSEKMMRTAMKKNVNPSGPIKQRFRYLSSMGQAYYKIGEYKKARDLFLSALEVPRGYPRINSLERFGFDIRSLYARLAKNEYALMNYQEADRYIALSIKASERAYAAGEQTKDELKEDYLEMAEIYLDNVDCLDKALEKTGVILRKVRVLYAPGTPDRKGMGNYFYYTVMYDIQSGDYRGLREKMNAFLGWVRALLGSDGNDGLAEYGDTIVMMLANASYYLAAEGEMEEAAGLSRMGLDIMERSGMVDPGKTDVAEADLYNTMFYGGLLAANGRYDRSEFYLDRLEECLGGVENGHDVYSAAYNSLYLLRIFTPLLKGENPGTQAPIGSMIGLFSGEGVKNIPERVSHVVNLFHPRLKKYFQEQTLALIGSGNEMVMPYMERNMIRHLVLAKSPGISEKLLDMFAGQVMLRGSGTADGERLVFLLENLLNLDLVSVSPILSGIDRIILSMQEADKNDITVEEAQGKKGKNGKKSAAASPNSALIKKLEQSRKQFEEKVTARDKLERSVNYLVEGDFVRTRKEAEEGRVLAAEGTNGSDTLFSELERNLTICGLWEEAEASYKARAFECALDGIVELGLFMDTVGLPPGAWQNAVKRFTEKMETFTRAEALYLSEVPSGEITVGDIGALRSGIRKMMDTLNRDIPEVERDAVFKDHVNRLKTLLDLLNGFDADAGETRLNKFMAKTREVKKKYTDDVRIKEICNLLLRTGKEAVRAIDDNTKKAMELFRDMSKKKYKEALDELIRIIKSLPAYADRKPVLEAMLAEARKYLKNTQFRRAEDIALLGMEYSAEAAGASENGERTMFGSFEEIYRQARGHLVLSRLKTDYNIINTEVEADLYRDEEILDTAKKSGKKPFRNREKDEFKQKKLVFRFDSLDRDPADVRSENLRMKELVRLSGLSSYKGIKGNEEVEIEDKNTMVRTSFTVGDTYTIVSKDYDPETRLFLKVAGLEEGDDKEITVLFEPMIAGERVDKAILDLPVKDVYVTRVSDPSLVIRRNLLDKMIWALQGILSGTGCLSSGNVLLDHAIGLKEIPGNADLSKVDVNFNNPKIASDPRQADAVRAGLCPDLPLTLIHGPPGTGKTSVIEEMVKQFVKQGKKVLVVSQSHAGVDNVGLRLKEGGVKFARVGNSPPSAEELLENWENRERLLAEMKHKGSVVLGTNNGFHLDKALTHKRDAEGKRVYDGYYAGDYDVVIIEEAGRATLAETIVPITFAKAGGKAILVGDHHQLPPYGISVEEIREIRKILVKNLLMRQKGKEIMSGLDRIFSYSNLRKYRESLFETHHNGGGDIRMRATGGKYKHLLDINRRSHWAIVGLVSKLFYVGKIKTDARDNSPATRPIERDTLELIDYGGTGKKHKKHESFSEPDRSYYNMTEVNIVLRKIEEALNKRRVDEQGGEPYRYGYKDITVITPYKAQIRQIRLGVKVKAILKGILSPLPGQEPDDLFTDEKMEILAEALDDPGDESGLDIIYDLEEAYRKGNGQLKRMLRTLAGKLKFDIDMDDLEKNRHPHWSDLGELDMVDVETVDSIQGSENDVVILSLVRSNLRGEIGFLGTYDGLERLDVAFSRSREKLWVVGDFANTLAKAEYHHPKDLAHRSDIQIANERKASAEKAREIFNMAVEYYDGIKKGIQGGSFDGWDSLPDRGTPPAPEEENLIRKAEKEEEPAMKEFVNYLYSLVDEGFKSGKKRVLAVDMSWVPDSQKAYVSDAMEALKEFLKKDNKDEWLKIITGGNPEHLAEELFDYVDKNNIIHHDIVIVGHKNISGVDPFEIFNENPADSAFMAYFSYKEGIDPEGADLEFTDIDLVGKIKEILGQAFGEYGKAARSMDISIEAKPVDTEILRIRNEARLAVLRKA
ncbi:MAG: AAA family ATPase [Candidatus Omnitrophica bacterium]|nr:AAA family ATPase [Candidatus Omnitrophota bacterium]